MKKELRHIEHRRTNSRDCSFYIYNLFEIKTNRIELKDIIELDILNEKYFQTEKELKEMKESWETYFPNNFKESKSIIIDSYGPISSLFLSENSYC